MVFKPLFDCNSLYEAPYIVLQHKHMCVNTHTPLGRPLPCSNAKISPGWNLAVLQQCTVVFSVLFSVLSHFKGAGMIAISWLCDHYENCESPAKEHCLTLSTPYPSHFLSQLLSLHLAPLQGLCVFAVPSAWCDFLCFISWLHALHPRDFCQMSLEISLTTTLLWETPHPSYPDLLFSVTVLITCYVHIICLLSSFPARISAPQSRIVLFCWCIPASQRGFQKSC